jgi:hypothetical protein
MAKAHPCGTTRKTTVTEPTVTAPDCKPICKPRKPPRGCDTPAPDHQELEPDSPLRKRANMELATLRERIPAGPALIYGYVMATVEQREGTLVHMGSGPNIQGGLITLCTCKHAMRTYRDVKPGTWIAGFSGSRTKSAWRPAMRNTLFYLMRVEHSFESHMALWRSHLVPEQARRRKSARHNPLGDLFEPHHDAHEPFDAGSYHPPIPGHAHAPEHEWPGGEWHRDIQYANRSGRHPARLVGHAELSFVWTRPLIQLEYTLSRGTARFESMQDLLAQLQPAS